MDSLKSLGAEEQLRHLKMRFAQELVDGAEGEEEREVRGEGRGGGLREPLPVPGLPCLRSANKEEEKGARGRSMILRRATEVIPLRMFSPRKSPELRPVRRVPRPRQVTTCCWELPR